jgi:hypothetical protein
MNKAILIFPAALLAASPALADHHEEGEKPTVEVVKMGEDGTPDIIKLDGFEVAVCKEGRTDGCINPRDAGLDFGSESINYWPGKPASEIEGDLPIDLEADDADLAEDD